MMKTINKDLVIIGAGPGGYDCACRAARNGLSVAVVEKEAVGGTCLNHGCIPTKALFKNAEVVHLLKNAGEFGIGNLNYELDYSAIQDRKTAVVEQLRGNIETMLNQSGVELIKGEAAFIGENRISVRQNDDNTEITAAYFLIATGSQEKIIPIEGAKLDKVLTSKEMLDIKEVPGKLIIVGGGVIGVEMATIFSALGSNVTILEYFDRLIPNMDKDISSRAKIYLKKLGIEAVNDALVEKIEQKDANLYVSGKTKKGKEFGYEADYVLMATGRKAFYDNLNLKAANVLCDKNGIIVNENMQTNIPHIYAAGDVTGKMMLAHVATYQSFKALDHIMNKENLTKFSVVPSCVFTIPEIACVGMTEDEARNLYPDVKVNKFLFRANGKAVSMGETEGFVKVIVNGGKLVGTHIIGPQASSLIEEAAVIIEREISIADAVNIIHPHPTLTEALLEALKGINE